MSKEINGRELLLRDLLRQHSRVEKPMPEAAIAGMRMVQCPACDGNHWKVVRTGDTLTECDFILRAKELGIET